MHDTENITNIFKNELKNKLFRKTHCKYYVCLLTDR